MILNEIFYSFTILGYPSLLKQQLRDLVLRRKSLVREEPESEEVAGDTHRQISFGQGSQNNQLKTGERIGTYILL